MSAHPRTHPGPAHHTGVSRKQTFTLAPYPYLAVLHVRLEGFLRVQASKANNKERHEKRKRKRKADIATDRKGQINRVKRQGGASQKKIHDIIE